MPRTDPLLLLTLLGLVGTAALATVHPAEPFDAHDPGRQRGRQVAIDLEVRSASPGESWLRGTATPTGSPTTMVSFIWFRPPTDAIHPGDRLIGRGTVSAGGGAIELVLDGPRAAEVDPGPHPVPVRWDDLVATPAAYTNRLLVLNGQIIGPHLVAPDGDIRCPLHPDSLRMSPASRFLSRLVLSPNSPGWTCIVEGAAP